LPYLSDAQKRVVAALMYARGDVAEAANYIGVSRQYVYEVIRKLRRKNVIFYCEPPYRILGLVPLLIVREPDGRSLPWQDYIVYSLEFYGFNGKMYETCVYVFPDDRIDILFRDLSSLCFITTELHDIYQPIPSVTLREFIRSVKRHSYARWSPKSLRRISLDRLDYLLLSEFSEDFFRPLKNIAGKFGVNKSTLSYHYRRHVRNLLRLRYYYQPDGKHPLFAAKLHIIDRNVFSLLLQADFIRLLLPSRDFEEAYVLLELSYRDFNDLIKSLPSLSDGVFETIIAGIVEDKSIKRKPLNLSQLKEDRILSL